MRILFFSEAVTLAHVARPLVLARGLSCFGHEVHFAVDGRYDALLGELPFRRHALDSISSQAFVAALSQGHPVYDYQTLEQYVSDDLALIEVVAPDVVIGDFRLSLAVSAALTSVSYWTITSPYWSPYARLKFPVPEIPLTHTFGVAVGQRLFDLFHRFVFARHALPMHRLRRRHGLPSLGFDLRRVYTHADHVCYAELEGLVPMAALPANHHWLGPVVWSPTVDTDEAWRRFACDEDGHKLVYVNLGSSGQVSAWPVIVEALADLPVKVLAATAGRYRAETVPENFFFADYLPGEAAVALSSLMVCNGGSPSTQQALSANVPVLGIPSNLDQHLNMQGVVGSRVGLCLRSEHLTPDALRCAVRVLLEDDAFGKRASELGTRYRAADSGASLHRLLQENRR